jgi:hypothetical protein
MLVKSSKSRFAAIAIMAFGVTTFMGTSAAVATGVTVSGTVGECAAASTVTANAVDFETVTKGTIGSKPLTTTITQGKKTDCSARNSDVSASITSRTGEAGDTPTGSKVIVAIADLSPGVFTVTADVPVGATATGTFGATVTLTLSDNT